MTSERWSIEKDEGHLIWQPLMSNEQNFKCLEELSERKHSNCFKSCASTIGMTKSRWNLQAIKITLVIKLQTSRHHTCGSQLQQHGYCRSTLATSTHVCQIIIKFLRIRFRQMMYIQRLYQILYFPLKISTFLKII